MNLKRKLLIIALSSVMAQSYAGDSLHVNSFNTFRLIKAENVWLETGNVAGLVFNQSVKVVNFETGLDNGNGDYHRIREGSSVNDYSFSTESYQVLKKRMFVSGKFAYHYVDDFGGQWNGTYDPYNGSPYILADSVSRTTYHRENYHLVGNIGYQLNKKLSLGCGLDYYAGVGAKQKDPRPQNTYVRFRINPALIYAAANYKLGFDLAYSNKKEEIEYDVFRTNFSPTFFTFKGFGFYTINIGTGFYRFVTANELDGGFQLEKRIAHLPTMTELRFNYKSEGVEDGGSVIRKLDGGDWNTYSLSLKELVQLRKGASEQKFEGKFSFFNGDGNEFIQNIVYEGTWNVPRYITTAENLKFNRQTITADLSYNFRKLTNATRINWEVEAGANFFNNSEQYYYIPEIFNAGYTNITGEIALHKNIYTGKYHLLLGLNGAYTNNLSNELLLSTLPEITKKQRKDLFQQEFDYYTSGLSQVGGEVKLGTSMFKVKNGGETYLGLRFDQVKQTNGNLSFSRFSAKIGFVF